MERVCYLCQSIILECMGSVHAGSFLTFLKTGKSPVFELCPKCASKFANKENTYPDPYLVKELDS